MSDIVPTSTPANGAAQPGTITTPTPPRPEITGSASRWTAGRVIGLVVGSLLVLTSLPVFGSGVTVLWADRTQRDSGFVTTGSHEFTTTGSAVATEMIELGDPGVGWLYAPLLLDDVQVRVTPADPDAALFVGIGPSGEVDRYLGLAGHSLISDFWSDQIEYVDGDAAVSPPGEQSFWVASDSGPGARTVSWVPAVGSWTVVVMNADGHEGVAFVADLGARMPSLPWIGVGLLLVGLVLAAGGTLMVRKAIRG